MWAGAEGVRAEEAQWECEEPGPRGCEQRVRAYLGFAHLGHSGLEVEMASAEELGQWVCATKAYPASALTIHSHACCAFCLLPIASIGQTLWHV